MCGYNEWNWFIIKQNQEKLEEEMINDIIGNGIYEVTQDKRLYDLKVFKSFLY